MRIIRSYILVTLLALLAGQGAWAQATQEVGVAFGFSQNQTWYRYSITPSNLASQQFISENQSNNYVEFKSANHNDQYAIGDSNIPLTMTINGYVNFINAGNFTVEDTIFKITFTSTTKYIMGARVTTNNDVTVANCAVEGAGTKTVIVKIPDDAVFSKVILNIANHTPFDKDNSVTISGIEDTYLDDGVNEPVPTVTYREFSNSTPVTLTAGTDYTVSYINNHYLGTATLTVTGTGNYTGSVTKDFYIRSYELSDFNSLGYNTYEIATKDDLDHLAIYVNRDNDCDGVTFKQTADIAYTATNAWDALQTVENNFTPIGGYGKPFSGTYDGDGYTISGIRMYRYNVGTSGHDNQSVGLFGYVSGGTVRNVVLRDANILGDHDFAGIVGYLGGGSVTGCTLYHVRVATSRFSFNNQNIVVGNHDSGTVSGNHYRDCIRCHDTIYLDYIERCDNVFALAAADGVTATYQSGESVTIDDVTYYAEGSTFSLSYSGNTPGANVVFSATAGTIDGNTFTMPAEDVTVGISSLSLGVTLVEGTKDGVTAYWGTFYDGTHRYTLPAGAAAYTMDSEYKLYRLGTDGRTIPANTAVVIISDKESITLNFDDSSTPITVNGGDNILKGSDTAVTVTAGKVDGKIPHVLGEVGSTIGFYPYTGASIPANKAYYVTTP